MGKTSDKNCLLFQLDVILWTIAFVLTLQLAIILFIPIAIYRKLVETSAKINQPDLARIAPPVQQIFFHDDFDQDGRVAFNIVTWKTLNGPLKLGNLQDLVRERLINQIRPNGKLEFPEFQQYFSFYGGHVFFKWDRAFDISNHVRYLQEAQDGSVVTESDLQKIISRQISKGWPKSRSPWEMLLVNNYRVDFEDDQEKSLLIFRFHHSLADGYSYLNFFARRLCQADNPVSAIPSSRKFRRWEKIFTFVVSSLRQPYDFVKLWRTLNKESSPWNPPHGTLRKEYAVVWSQPISVDVIKKIKSRHGVSFKSVLNSVIAGTIQSLMTRAGQEAPQIMNAFMSFPVENHPGGLCLDTLVSLAQVPVAVKDPLKRLKAADKFWMDAIHSTAKWMIQKGFAVFGRFPWAVCDKIFHSDLPNIAISSFPGVQGDVFLDKKKVLECNFAVGTERDSAAASFSTLSCFGTLRFVMVVDKTVYPDEDVGQYFNEYIQREIECLMDPKPFNQVDTTAPSEDAILICKLLSQPSPVAIVAFG